MNRFAIFSYVFIFLLKLRFPKGKSFTDIVTNRYGRDTLAAYRKLEKTHFKLHKVKLDIEFLITCKAYSIIPKFLSFKTYKRHVMSTNMYKSFQFKLLNFELKDKHKIHKSLESEFTNLRDQLRNDLSWIDFKCIFNRLLLSNGSKLKSAKSTHDKKLKDLGIPLGCSVDRDKVVINLSGRSLTDSEREVLSLGLTFSLPKFKLDFVQHYFYFEKLLSILKNIKNEPSSSGNFNSLLQSISSIAHQSFAKFKEAKHSFPKLPVPLFEALKSLKADKDIIITRPDKGRGTVILNKSEYISKVESILNDTTKFKVIIENAFTYITRLEDKLGRTLRKLLKTKVISKECFNFLFSSGSSPGILYGLPKIHKIGNPIRPILSTIGTFNYNLAKYFVKIIEPLTTNQYTTKNSFEFVNELKNIDITNKVMASFDVESLFTNIPLDETIQIISDTFFSDCDNFMGYKKDQFRDLLSQAVKDTPFYFGDKLYVQIDGVGMGSCLGPTFANAFLCFHECNWLNDCPSTFKPIFYRRYVDDTFVLFNDPSHVPQFLSYLNSKHPNIKFTYEIEKDSKLSFLDVLVSRVAGKTVTSVYRKPTFTGLGTKFTSFIPESFKINSIITMFNRCYNISSNWFCFDSEIRFIKCFFQNNGFPLHVINKIISKYLDLKINSKNNNEAKNSDVQYIRFPFFGHLSYEIRNNLSKLLKHHYPNTKFVFIFTNSLTIGSFFRFKDSIPQNLVSNIIYGFTCSRCKSRYIGETRRNLTLRFAEHMGISARTGRILASPTFSSIRDHSFSCKHKFSITDFDILRKVKSSSDLKIVEALLIKHNKPELNSQTESNILNLFL